MNSFFIIAGPCAVEDESTCKFIAGSVNDICKSLNIEYIFKASYKKANRTKIDSFTTIGKATALKIIKGIHNEFKIPVLTDVHESHECKYVAEFVDYLQIPAFLCRQTDLLTAAGKTGKIVNIKKGQFMSPDAMQYALEKVLSTGNRNVLLTERGTTFGYNNLVVDFTSVPKMKKFGSKVVVDCTHSVQIPNQTSGVTGGDSEMIETICLAAIAAGADGLFIETHPNPTEASSDKASMLKLDKLEKILSKCVKIRSALQF